MDWTEGPKDSCHAYVEDDCVYTGERKGEYEPVPGHVEDREECRKWAELWVEDGVAFFHYISTSEECRLYRTLDTVCHSVGGPKAAPSFDQCTVNCPEGWNLAGSSCYLLSTETIRHFSEAVKFCEERGSTLVEVNQLTLMMLTSMLILISEGEQ